MTARAQDLAWLRAELERLAAQAEEFAAEEREKATADHDRGETEDAAAGYARADSDQHYAKEIRRILRGETWAESYRREVSETRARAQKSAQAKVPPRMRRRPK